ncbi:class I SAM-dependent methyltransferase [Micromonospora haikouensis]|uniref:class I SAM-dependent methyltransferase n=1 Tax=Micromonospora haikouensis TaxID=686309 RepID=UPI003413AC3A
MDDADGRVLVEHGYDALSYHYRADDAGDGQYAPWLAALHRRLPGAATVLDLGCGCGCGCGVPAARFLAAAGHHVTGVDISAVQVERARRLVPTGTFRRADATRVDLPSSTCPCPSSPASSGASSPGCARAAGCWPPSATARGRAPRRTGSAAPPPCGGAMPTRRPTAPGCGRSSGGAQPCRAGGGIPAAGYPHVADMAGPARGPAPPGVGSARVRDEGPFRYLVVCGVLFPDAWRQGAGSMHSMNFHDWRARSECSPNEGRRGTRERRGITPPGRASCRSVGLVAVQAEPGHRGLCCPQWVWHHHGIFTPPVLPVS